MNGWQFRFNFNEHNYLPINSEPSVPVPDNLLVDSKFVVSKSNHTLFITRNRLHFIFTE